MKTTTEITITTEAHAQATTTTITIGSSGTFDDGSAWTNGVTEKTFTTIDKDDYDSPYYYLDTDIDGDGLKHFLNALFGNQGRN